MRFKVEISVCKTTTRVSQQARLCYGVVLTAGGLLRAGKNSFKLPITSDDQAIVPLRLPVPRSIFGSDPDSHDWHTRGYHISLTKKGRL